MHRKRKLDKDTRLVKGLMLDHGSIAEPWRSFWTRRAASSRISTRSISRS